MKKDPLSVELLSIGTELIKGECVDDNSPYLSRVLSKIGLNCRQFTVVPDFPFSSLVQTIRNSFEKSDMVILSGGLGPTDDDVTREAIAKALGRRLTLSPPLLGQIQRNFTKRHLRMPKINERQAYLPQGARVIPNPIGSAPGILIEKRKKILISLPGVPQELQAMFKKAVLPYLKRRFPHLVPSLSIRLRTTGLAESRVNELLQDLVRRERKITFGFYAHPGIVDVKLMVEARNPQGKNILKKVEKAACERLKPFLFGKEDQTLEAVVFHLLEKRKQTVSVAESCTGGTLSGELTKLPGSSRHFKMGVVAYSNESKVFLLGIPKKLIRSHGAVSEAVAEALAKQAKKLGKTDFGLGVTGILGPSGGTKEKPVGLVYIAVNFSKRLFSQKFYFVGERETLRVRVVKAALDMLRRELK